MAIAKKDMTAALLEVHGQTFADELGIDLDRAAPSDLFRLLCASVLYSARISSDIATNAAKELFRRWRTAKAMADASWQDRVDVLNPAGYARYDERTSAMLGDLSRHLLDRWDGDLRKLREEASRDPSAERKLLKEAKGMGDVGVDIFFREAQVAWPELVPFADKRALKAAERLDLGSDAKTLARRVDGNREVARLVAALVRTDLHNDYDRVREAARNR